MRHLSQLCGIVALLLGLLVSAGAEEGYDEETFYDEEETTTEDDGPAMLGIQMTPPPRRVIEREGLDPDEGVYVFRVYPDSAAEELGLQPGDVITEVNGTRITSMSDLRTVVENSAIGEEASVSVSRRGERLSMDGAPFRRWPDHLPRGEIDAAAEERYRRQQMRREEAYARNLEEAARIQEQTQALEDQLAAAAEQMPGLRDARRRAQAISRATGRDPEVLPLALLALPGWRFDYQLGVAATAPTPAAHDPAVPPRVAAPATAPRLPALDLDYGFTVHGGAL